jgi:putative flippase GtrA
LRARTGGHELNESAERAHSRAGAWQHLCDRFRILAREAARFGVVGGLGFIITEAGTNGLRHLGRMDWLEANVIATVAAAVVTYLGSRFWTFRHRERGAIGRETVLFVILNATGLLIQLACLGFTVHVLGRGDDVDANVALLVGIAFGTLFRFWSYRKWVWTAASGTAELPLEPAGPSTVR